MDTTQPGGKAGTAFGKNLTFWITEVRCLRETSETGQDEIYFKIEKGAMPEYYYHSNPLKMSKGFALPADIVLSIGSSVREMTINLIEKDSLTNPDGDDPIGSIYLERENFVTGSTTIDQTYGDAQAQYKVSWKVLPQGYHGPERTFKFTQIKCDKDTTESGNDEIFFQTYKDAHGPSTYYKDNPLGMKHGSLKDIDIKEAVGGTKAKTLRMDIREKDSNNVDKIGTVYLLCNEKSGTETVYQTTGDAKAVYELTWTVA